MTDGIIELKAATYAADVEANKGILVVYFWAPWCGHCKAFTPTYESVAKQLGADVTFAKVNCDEQTAAAVHCNVSGTPTILIYKQGKEVDRIVGGMPSDHLIERIEKQRAS
jgi:thioredoxin 1